MTSTSGVQVSTIDLSSAHIPRLLVSLAVAFSSAFAIAKVGEALKLDPTLVSGMSQMAMGSGLVVYQVISRRRGGGITPVGIVRFSGFELSWLVAATMGALVIVFVGNATGLIGALVTGTIEGVIGASIIGAVGASFFVGRWIGVRADRFALPAAFVSAYLARLLGTVVDFLIVPEDIKQQLGMAVSVDYLVVLAIGGGLWAIAAVIGAFIGRRQREAGYVAYLLRRIPSDTRQSVIDMVYEESKVQEALATPSGTKATA
jgi:hypothetical protein